VKANRAARARGEEAVSSVVSAILLFALFTTAFTLWTITTLPTWVAEREQQHAHGVQESFAALSAALDTLSAADDTGPSTIPVVLGPDAVPLVQSTPATGELSLRDTLTARATFVGESLHVADGVSVGQPDDAIDEGSGDRLDDIHVLQALVVLLSTTSVGNGERAWITVVADDGVGGTVTATITHAGKLSGSGPNVAGCLNSELRIEVSVSIPPFTPYTATQALLCELASDLTGYSLDLASPLYPFVDGIDRLETPFSVTLTDSSTGGSAAANGFFAAAYVDSDGLAQGVGSGELVDYQLDQQGRRLLYRPAYQHYQDQEVSWEFGARVVAQSDGAVVLAPAFELATDGSLGSLSWTLVETNGEGSHAGRDQATARVTHERTTDLVLSADGATFTLTTPSAAAWRSFFGSQVLLSDTGANVVVSGTGDTATLTLASTTLTGWRIHLRVVQADVVVA
jgi:hypothetical protein